MINPYGSPRSHAANGIERRFSSQTRLGVFLGFDVACVLGSLFTKGTPFLTLSVIACFGGIATFSVARNERRFFVWTGLAALVAAIVGTEAYITHVYGVLPRRTTYIIQPERITAFSWAAAISLPVAAIVGTNCGIMLHRFLRKSAIGNEYDDANVDSKTTTGAPR